MATHLLPHRSPKMGRDPNQPLIPMGGSKNEVLYIVAAILILVVIALSFWFESGR